ncbi:hypothetical protein DFH08DRAFT_814636 [Mycena albidolilacea]|uniref:Uncharacterized protein n=1 Tax=Mycena albidolilacea TaxID=1033008 RepID=A0AAD6ZQ15_9AGAR|nr:hypothetical protein DFH08DRAFT_814636 [Mycena albidolilacea]
MASSSPTHRSDDSDGEDYNLLMSAVTPVKTPAPNCKRNTDHLDTSDVPLIISGGMIFLPSQYRSGNFVVGTEHNQAAMDVVQKFIAKVFTQSCSIIKKELVKSVENPRAKNTGQKHVPSLWPKATHTMIYQLTKTIVQKLSGGKFISIHITPGFCARVAMMRKWHVKKIEGPLSLTAMTTGSWLMTTCKRFIPLPAATTPPIRRSLRSVSQTFSMLEKDHRRHGSNPDKEIPTATTTTNNTVISYQADIDVALDARNQGQDLPTTAEGGGE